MAKNVEIKAHADDYQSIFDRANQIADHGPTVINQDDTFYNCQSGRLKLRVFSKTKGELIFYQRANQGGPKESFYIISPTISPETLNETLTLAYGVMGNVRKRRILFLVGRTRIHLDQVENLGDFVELEVVLKESESADTGIVEANGLMEILGINHKRLIENAYVDLISEKAA